MKIYKTKDQYYVDLIEGENIKILIDDEVKYNRTVATDKEAKVVFGFEERDIPT